MLDIVESAWISQGIIIQRRHDKEQIVMSSLAIVHINQGAQSLYASVQGYRLTIANRSHLDLIMDNPYPPLRRIHHAVSDVSIRPCRLRPSHI